MYCDRPIYQQCLNSNVARGVEDLLEKYHDSGVRVPNKDLYPRYAEIVNKLSQLYKAELAGTIKREDPHYAAYALRCFKLTKSNIVLVLTT